MSAKHPIISVTGSSGAGTTSVRKTFEQIFRREKITAVFIEGDAFHRHNREDMQRVMAEAAEKGNHNMSHFGEEANLLSELELLFKTYGEIGTGRARHYVHDAQEAEIYGTPPGTFTAWEEIPYGTDLMIYEGLHGASVTGKVNIARLADLKIGVVPVINLEWIQKIHRDKDERGYSADAVTDVILRRMPDYVKYICPQFTETDINFQRIPTVDTSNPFVARWIPTPDESMVVIRFKNPRGIDFSYLQSMIQQSFMSRANSIVIPGGKLDLAMQLILTPMILQLMERKRRTFF
ncbi:MAG: phosphoribulokinase [Hyphomicrobium sp.]|jgi:phosphoribulokinase